MSQLPASTCKGSVWQYCNYGYDKTKYSSFHDCLTKKTKSDCGKREDMVSPPIIKSCAEVYGEGSVKATMPIGLTTTMTSVCEDGYEKKSGKVQGSCCVPVTKKASVKSNKIVGIAVVVLVIYLITKK